jgi:hypothetical protein
MVDKFCSSKTAHLAAGHQSMNHNQTIVDIAAARARPKYYLYSRAAQSLND